MLQLSVHGITDENEDIVFATKLELFSIGIINLLETFSFIKT
jgi:hypothetical protein